MVLMKTKTGDRRNYVEVQSPTRTADGQGGWVTTWSTIVSEWARAVQMAQNPVLDQGGIKYTMAVEFTIRKRNDTVPIVYSTSITGAVSNMITGANRIVWNGANYTIHSVVPSEKIDDLIITAYV
jgi:head-tail adaptor